MKLVIENRIPQPERRPMQMLPLILGLLLGGVVMYLILLPDLKKPTQAQQGGAPSGEPSQGSPPSGHKVNPEVVRPAPAEPVEKTVPATPPDRVEKAPPRKSPVAEATAPASPPTK